MNALEYLPPQTRADLEKFVADAVQKRLAPVLIAYAAALVFVYLVKK